MATSMETACCTCTLMGSRRKCLKPAFSTLRLYAPGLRFTNEYNPSGLVVNVSVEPVPWLVSVTTAPAMEAPDASETVPESEPKVDCAATGTLNVARQAKKTNTLRRGKINERKRKLLIFQILPPQKALRP